MKEEEAALPQNDGSSESDEMAIKETKANRYWDWGSVSTEVRILDDWIDGGSGERAKKGLQRRRPVESVRSEVSMDLDYGCVADGFSDLSPASASKRSLSVAGFPIGDFTGSTFSSSRQG
jgi:hypothetical protein